MTGIIANNLFNDFTIILSQGPSIQIINNTLYDCNILFSGDYGETEISDNLFYNCSNGINITNNENDFINLHYNCFFQVENIDELAQIDETNLFENPGW